MTGFADVLGWRVSEDIKTMLKVLEWKGSRQKRRLREQLCGKISHVTSEIVSGLSTLIQ